MNQPNDATPGAATTSSADELRELAEVVTSDWQRSMFANVDMAGAMQATLSWRITKPLRLIDRRGRAVDGLAEPEARKSRAVAVVERIRHRGA